MKILSKKIILSSLITTQTWQRTNSQKNISKTIVFLRDFQAKKVVGFPLVQVPSEKPAKRSKQFSTKERPPFNPLSANVGYIRHGLWRRAKPSCNAQFQLEIVIFGPTRRNWIVLHDQAKDNLKVSLSSEILSQKVKKKCKNLTKIHLFEILNVFWLFLVNEWS